MLEQYNKLFLLENCTVLRRNGFKTARRCQMLKELVKSSSISFFVWFDQTNEENIYKSSALKGLDELAALQPK